MDKKEKVTMKIASEQNRKKTLGILGGLGPMATVYFYEMITAHTEAKRDQDHIDIIISSRASTPDRTAFICGEVSESPLVYMTEDARKLESFGAEIIAIPCNTAHYFYDSVSEAVKVPVLNIIKETVGYIKEKGMKKAGIMATAGTIMTHAYQQVCESSGIGCEIPDEEDQKALMGIIYNDIKCGKPADMVCFNRISDNFRKRGCDCIILGCTELSLIKKEEKLDGTFVDSLEVLAMRTITECGKNPVGFDDMMLCETSSLRNK